MKDLILALEIGNTSIHLGFFTHPSPREHPKLIAQENILTAQALKFFKRWRHHRESLPFAGSRISSSVKLALMSSARPATDKIVEHWVKEVFRIKPLQARKDFRIPLSLMVDEPSKVGVDRLLNAFAAYHLTRKLTLVIDFGTAITLDIVSAQGEFLGGLIAPGLTSMTRTLHQDCALLPLIRPRPTKRAIGKNTEQAMQAGLYLGTIGLIRYLVQKISEELKRHPYIIATGGEAKLMKRDLPFVKKIIPDLTLQGLVLAYLTSGRTS